MLTSCLCSFNKLCIKGPAHDRPFAGFSKCRVLHDQASTAIQLLVHAHRAYAEHQQPRVSRRHCLPKKQTCGVSVSSAPCIQNSRASDRPCVAAPSLTSAYDASEGCSQVHLPSCFLEETLRPYARRLACSRKEACIQRAMHGWPLADLRLGRLRRAPWNQGRCSCPCAGWSRGIIVGLMPCRLNQKVVHQMAHAWLALRWPQPGAPATGAQGRGRRSRPAAHSSAPRPCRAPAASGLWRTRLGIAASSAWAGRRLPHHQPRSATVHVKLVYRIDGEPFVWQNLQSVNPAAFSVMN